jgi:hypothetical protein
MAPPRPVAELARRPWDARMVRFLKVKRRQGRPIRWIAERLGLDLLRVVAKAVNLRLTLRTAYRGRACKTPQVAEPPPLGPQNEIADDGLCRWIAADPAGPWAMCARPTAEDSAYCPHHKQRAYASRKPLIATNIAFAAAPDQPNKFVMAGLDPATQGSQAQTHGVTPPDPASNPLGGRVKPGHDDKEAETRAGEGLAACENFAPAPLPLAGEGGERGARDG